MALQFYSLVALPEVGIGEKGGRGGDLQAERVRDTAHF